MCGQVGVPAAVSSVSLIVEILLVLASGSLVAALAIPLILTDPRLQGLQLGPIALDGRLTVAFGALVLVGGLVALHPLILRPVIVVAARLLRRPLDHAP